MRRCAASQNLPKPPKTLFLHLFNDSPCILTRLRCYESETHLHIVVSSTSHCTKMTKIIDLPTEIVNEIALLLLYSDDFLFGDGNLPSSQAIRSVGRLRPRYKYSANKSQHAWTEAASRYRRIFFGPYISMKKLSILSQDAKYGPAAEISTPVD